MNEISKTGIFAGAAAVLSLLAYVTETPTTSNIEQVAEERVGEVLFPNFTKPLDVATLKIVNYDQDLGQLEQFEVTRDRKSGLWTLPSHDSYPADAEDQMSNAANALIGVKILALASSVPEDQKLFGVLEPNAEKLSVGDVGVGQLVRMQDENGERIADLVIGKKVKDSETQRYVRISTNDQIYVAEVDAKSFSTDFKQWIDKDLLKLSSTDVRKLDIRDYDIIRTAQGGQRSREFEAVVRFDTADGKWQPEKIINYTGGVEEPRELAADEELNSKQLDTIKTALDSLQLVDVARKPVGLAADLKADQALLKDTASIQSLVTKGFFPQPAPDGSTELYASSGELLVSLQDGVQYLLRFGNTTNAKIKSEGAEEGEDSTEADSTASDILDISRFLLVTTKVDESMIPEVVLEKVPQSVEELEEMDRAAAASAVPAAPQPEQTEIGTEAEDTAQTAQPEEDAESNGDDAAAESSVDEPASDTVDPALDPATVDQDSSPAEESTTPDSQPQSRTGNRDSTKFVAFQAEEAPAVSEAPADTPAADVAGEAEATPAADAAPAAEPSQEETAEEKQERLQAVQEKITKANQRKIDERDEKLEAAKKRVAELNARFAEWYYVIGESQYQKLRIEFGDLIQNKNAANAPSFSPPPGGDFNFNPLQN